MKKNLKRVGATIERTSVKRFLKRLKNNIEESRMGPQCLDLDEINGQLEIVRQIETYLMKRFDRISKDKGGL